MTFRVLIIGGTGQVGAAVVRALAAEPSCAEVVMVNRKAISLPADPRLRQVILDTAAAQFPAEVTKLAQSMVAQGDPVYGASCVGVGQGSMKWSEEELKALEIGVVGGFARGCHAGGITQFALLSAVGSSARSRIRYARVMGLKEETVQGIGFTRLAIFRPGIIAGNAHTPSYAAWLGRLIPGPFGTIEQDDIARAFVAEFMSSSVPSGVVYLENGAMRQRSRAFRSPPLAVALLAVSLAASALAQAGARDRHIVIVTPPDDVRLAATREAIDFWNGTLSGLHLDPRLVEDRVLVAPPSTRKLEQYTRQIWNLAGRPSPSDMTPPPPPELDAIGGDIVVFLSNQRIFSFAWPRAERRKFFIGIQTDTEEPLTFPNVTRNVIAHELGHALGLEHNGPTTTLMCGPCEHFVYRSEAPQFLPVTPAEHARLRQLYGSP